MAFIAIAFSLNAQKKNVLLIISDDFNFWLPEIGYYPQAKTPNLSALAKKGVLFTDAQNSSPVCNPSRNAFMSGLRPSTSGISANQDGYVRDKPGCAKALTMNQYFTQQGYHTVAGGKIYHPGKMGGKTTDPNNWSELYTGGSGASGGSAYKWAVGGGSPIKWSASTGSLNNNNDTKLANHFANRIKTYNKNKPFFFAVGLFRPHLPWNCPKQFYDKFNPKSLSKPAGYKAGDGSPGSEHKVITNNNKWNEAIRAYLANLAYADYNVGILLNALDTSPYKNNTIVVFTGDHGWHLGEKGHWKKSAMWDQANHTTFIIYDPSATGNGQKCHKVVSLQDMYPTLVDIAGLPGTNKIEGESLAPLLKNPKLNSWNKPVMMTYRGTHYIKNNNYKLIDDGGNSKLYDVVKDPYEFNNLYGKAGYNNVVNQLRGNISNFIKIGNQVKKNLGGGNNNPSFKDVTDLTATATGCKKVVLNWTDNNTGESGYRVRRKEPGGKYITLGDAAANAETYTDNSAAEKKTYIYQVRALDKGVAVKASNNPQVTTPACNNNGGNASISFTNTIKDCNAKGKPRNNVFFTVSGSHTNVQISRGALVSQGANKYKIRDANLAFNKSYTYTVTLKNGSTTVATKSTTVKTVSSCPKSVEVEKATIAELSVYPNPTNGELTIDYNALNNPTIQIINLSGQIILEIQNIEAGSVLDLNNLSNGHYLIRISDNKTNIVEKLILN